MGGRIKCTRDEIFHAGNQPGGMYYHTIDLIKHFSKRTKEIDSIIVHYISAKHPKYAAIEGKWSYKGVRAILEDYRLSYHYIIDRMGGIYYLVDEKSKAWHAGESSLHGDEDMNQCSIGVALIGTSTENFTTSQVKANVELFNNILHRHKNIKLNRIVGHQDVAPGRKKDPGPKYPWLDVFNGVRRPKYEL